MQLSGSWAGSPHPGSSGKCRPGSGLAETGLALSANGINEWLTHSNRSTKAWLFVRGSESVRIVIDGTSMGVYGPGSKYSQSRFGEAMDATLHQAAVEHSLVLEGWTLEHFTAERRSNA